MVGYNQSGLPENGYQTAARDRVERVIITHSRVFVYAETIQEVEMLTEVTALLQETCSSILRWRTPKRQLQFSLRIHTWICRWQTAHLLSFTLTEAQMCSICQSRAFFNKSTPGGTVLLQVLQCPRLSQSNLYNTTRCHANRLHMFMKHHCILMHLITRKTVIESGFTPHHPRKHIFA